MQEVSEAWKEAHRQMLLPETFVEITLSLTDDSAAKELNTVTDYQGSTFSNPEGVIDYSRDTPTEPYALLEHNLWTLDGSRSIVEDLDGYKGLGFVSTEKSLFGSVSFRWQRTRTSPIPGLTITWSSEYGEYPTEFSVKTLGTDGMKISEVVVSDNQSNVSTVNFPMSDYGIIAIETRNWSFPDHRRRIDRVLFGVVEVFDKSHILNYSHEQTGDPLNTELATNKITFSLNNFGDRWNILNPEGSAKYLYERQSVQVRYGMDVNGSTEWIPGGVFYLSEWSVPQNGHEANFVARDLFEFLLNAEYSRPGINGTIANSAGGAVYSDHYGNGTLVGTLSNGESVILSQAINTGDIWVKVARVEGVSLRGWTKKDNVQYNQDPLVSDLVSDALSKSQLPDNKTISVPSDFGNFTADKWVIERTSVAVILQRVCASLLTKCFSDRTGELVFQKGNNALSDYVISQQVAYGHPEIERTTPIKTFVEVISTNHPDGTIVENNSHFGDEGETLRFNNELGIGYRGDVFNPLDYKVSFVNYWKRYGGKAKTIVSGEFRADPRLDLFDVVTVESKYGNISPVMITSIKYTYNGAFSGAYTGRVIGEEG